MKTQDEITDYVISDFVSCATIDWCSNYGEAKVSNTNDVGAILELWADESP